MSVRLDSPLSVETLDFLRIASERSCTVIPNLLDRAGAADPLFFKSVRIGISVSCEGGGNSSTSSSSSQTMFPGPAEDEVGSIPVSLP